MGANWGAAGGSSFQGKGKKKHIPKRAPHPHPPAASGRRTLPPPSFCPSPDLGPARADGVWRRRDGAPRGLGRGSSVGSGPAAGLRGGRGGPAAPLGPECGGALPRLVRASSAGSRPEPNKGAARSAPAPAARAPPRAPLARRARLGNFAANFPGVSARGPRGSADGRPARPAPSCSYPRAPSATPGASPCCPQGLDSAPPHPAGAGHLRAAPRPGVRGRSPWASKRTAAAARRRPHPLPPSTFSSRVQYDDFQNSLVRSLPSPRQPLVSIIRICGASNEKPLLRGNSMPLTRKHASTGQIN